VEAEEEVQEGTQQAQEEDQNLTESSQVAKGVPYREKKTQ